MEGRHLGHYKAAAKSQRLSTLHSQLMNIPLLGSFSPSRWCYIMLQKHSGDHRVHRLRIIALQESDFKQANRIVIGKPIQPMLEDTKDLPDMQHGSQPAKQCHSAVLNKVLTYEIHQYQKQPLAFIENDAVGCFDRIVNPLVLTFLQILGVKPSLLQFLSRTWEQTYHNIRTLFGTSQKTYCNTENYLYTVRVKYPPLDPSCGSYVSC